MTAHVQPTAAPASGETYRYLEPRAHPWRQEWYLKGRNMTVGQLVYGMRANQLSPEAAAENYDLPLAQVQEALRYYQQHRELIEADVDEERRRAAARGIILDPPTVPR